jgi:actin-like ATPase involved in cell morphogenesis
MSPAGFALGIDLGTSNTVAMLRWPDGRVKPLLFDSSPLLPSAVFAATDGRLVVGRDALHHARFAPAQLEPNPKRRIDEERLLLGDREVEVTALMTAVLRHVYDEAIRVTGGGAPAVALAHPAGWGPVRRLVLADAAQAAGLGEVTFVPEPVAAAHYFTDVLRHQLPAGGALVVYDFGAGTFDASVVRRVDAGAARPADDDLRVVAVDGLDDVGGLDVDAAVVDWLRSAGSAAATSATANSATANSAADGASVWARLTNPDTSGDARERRLLWEDVRTGKEVLSRSTSVELRLPLLDREVRLTRDEFDRVAGPLVERTVRTTASLVRHAHLDPSQITGVFLVGGSSRIPLVAARLEGTLGVRPAIAEQPELVVAEGCLHVLPVSNPALWATLPLPRDPTHNFREVVASEHPGHHDFREVVPINETAPRGVAGRVTLAVLVTAALLVAGGVASGIVRLPHLPGLGTSKASGTTGGSPTTTPSPSTIVPADWHTFITDKLRSPGNWQGDTDPSNTSTCTVDGQLTVAKKTSGTYRCKGPTTPLDDEAISVDVTLMSDDVCGGVWLRFGPAQATGAEAGYLLEVCRDRYVLAAHGLPDSSKVTPIEAYPVSLDLNTAARVGVLARGSSLEFYLGGKRVGLATRTEFTRGRTLLGVVVPAAGGGVHKVAFANIEISKPTA